MHSLATQTVIFMYKYSSYYKSVAIWILLGRRNFAVFAGIPPGDRTFPPAYVHIVTKRLFYSKRCICDADRGLSKDGGTRGPMQRIPAPAETALITGITIPTSVWKCA